MSLIILSGPCGVRKTSVAKLLSKHLAAPVVDLDKTELRREARSDFQGVVRPLRDDLGENVIVDVGGSTLFRREADHAEQCQQPEALRSQGARVVLLTCERAKLKDRYMAFPGSHERYFDGDFEEWLRLAVGNWRQLADVEVDSTNQDPEATPRLVLSLLSAEGR